MTSQHLKIPRITSQYLSTFVIVARTRRLRPGARATAAQADQLETTLMNHGIPVAVSGIETRRDWFTVRYICARCRQIWDCSFAGEGLGPGGIGEFEDRYLGSRDNVKAYPQDGIPWPAGPVERLRQEPPASS